MNDEPDLLPVLLDLQRRGFVVRLNLDPDPRKDKWKLTEAGRRNVELGFPQEGFA